MRTLALSLLIFGYIALVPTCFLAPFASLHAHGDMSGMIMPEASGPACMDTLFYHQGMVLSMTGIAESVTFALACFALLSFVLVALALLSRPAILLIRRHRREPPPSFLASLRLVAWLSLKEASPQIV